MISFCFQNQIVLNYKMDEKKLNSILSKHIAPVAETEIVKFQLYYCTKRLSKLMIKNKLWKNSNKDMRNHVFYQYNCDTADFSFSSYIGYTTCSLYVKFKMHTQTGFIIQNHQNAHNINRVPQSQLLDKTEVIAMDRDKRRMVMLEALLNEWN